MRQSQRHQYRPLSRARLLARRDAGFTLSELVIASLLGGLVITAIGSVIISQIRQNVGFETKRQLAEDWGRVAGFIEAELFLAERTYPVDGTTTGSTVISKIGSSNVCGFNANDIKLGLILKDAATTVVYAVSAMTDAEKRIWNGSYALRRCGPLDTSANGVGALTGQAKNSILVGSLPDASSFAAKRGINSLGGALAARDVSVTLSLAKNATQYSGTFGGQARVSPSYNLLNDEASTGSACSLDTKETALLCGGASTTLEFTASNCPEYPGSLTQRTLITDPQYNCDLSRVHQFKPSDTTTLIIGSKEASREDTVYFPNNRSTYTIDSDCNSNSCQVTGSGMNLTIKEGEVLVFRDSEARI